MFASWIHENCELICLFILYTSRKICYRVHKEWICARRALPVQVDPFEQFLLELCLYTSDISHVEFLSEFKLIYFDTNN